MGSKASMPASTFAQKLRDKFPQFANVPDDSLLQAFLKTNPQYCIEYNGNTPVNVTWTTQPQTVAKQANEAAEKVPAVVAKAADSRPHESATRDSRQEQPQTPQEVTATTPKKCLNCAVEIAENANFCLKCGQSQSPEPPTNTQAPPANLERKLCAFCKGANSPNSKFCVICGRSFESVGTIKNQPPRNGDPQPVVAGILAGLLPGAGAVYNGQYAKGWGYLAINLCLAVGRQQRSPLNTISTFALLAFWVWQIVEAVRTAKSLQRSGKTNGMSTMKRAVSVAALFVTSVVVMAAVFLVEDRINQSVASKAGTIVENERSSEPTTPPENSTDSHASSMPEDTEAEIASFLAANIPDSDYGMHISNRAVLIKGDYLVVNQDFVNSQTGDQEHLVIKVRISEVLLAEAAGTEVDIACGPPRDSHGDALTLNSSVSCVHFSVGAYGKGMTGVKITNVPQAEAVAGKLNGLILLHVKARYR